MTKALVGRRSELIAEILNRSWRTNPPPLEISASELDQVAPLLQGSGAAALGWWRISRSSQLKDREAARELEQSYRLLLLRDSVHQRDIKGAIELLRSAGVEPLLAKGWAMARLYPDAALRPYGDMDICVRPEQYRRAEDVLASPEGKKYWVDLHQGFSEIQDRSVDDLFARSRLVQLEEVEVRLMGAEDHLALLSIHLLKHGAWRPLWLCDIGVAIETRSSDFDWQACLGQDKRRAKWITSTIGLAHQLLGAEIDDLPFAAWTRNLPKWLVPNVLRQWETPYANLQAPTRHSAPMSSYLRNPRGLLKDMRQRWPDPITATISLEGPFNNLPRLPFQIGNCLSRTAQFLRHLPSKLREQG
ncbi:MAG TPA: nucleotidyltransferase family protein [Pyrinomonadaceae bacterium]|jgi:hypothetical protein